MFLLNKYTYIYLKTEVEALLHFQMCTRILHRITSPLRIFLNRAIRPLNHCHSPLAMPSMSSFILQPSHKIFSGKMGMQQEQKSLHFECQNSDFTCVLTHKLRMPLE